MLRTLARTLLPLLLLLSFGCAKFADRKLNSVSIAPPYTPSPYTAEFHKTLSVVDLHADQLLWDRDLLQRSDYGHVDLPRLQDGNVALQVFGVVTGFPLFPCMDNNKDTSDAVATLAKLQEWPTEAHTSRFERARYQAKRLADGITAAQGAELYPAAYAHYMARDLDYDFETGESLRRFAERVADGIDWLVRHHNGQTIAAVSHSGVLDVVYRRATGRPLSTPRDFKIPTSALTWFHSEGQGWHLEAGGARHQLHEVLSEPPE